MKILIVSDAWYPQVNGVVRTYEYLREKLINRGHEVKIIGPSDFPVRIPIPGYRKIKLALFPKRRLRRKIDHFKPDRILIATEGPLGWAARNICKKLNFDFTTSYHTHFPEYITQRIPRLLKFLRKPVYKIAIATLRKFHNTSSTIFVATPSLEKSLRKQGFTAPMKRLTRGVDLDIFHTEGSDDLFKDLPKPVALYVGRIAVEKNLERFLEMDWQGSKVIVGDGPSLTYLRQRFPDAHFLGEKLQKDLAAHYRSADVFVFPSRTETFGIVLIEALACGLPVAAYPVTGPIDIITEPNLGVLNDDLGLAAIEALKHGSPKERHAYVQKFFNWELACEQFLTGLNVEFEKKDPREKRTSLKGYQAAEPPMISLASLSK